MAWEKEMNSNIKQGIKLGFIGGLLGTIIMDVVIVVLFSILGMPIDLIYAFIGAVADSFLSKVGIDFQGGVLLGAAIHFLLGIGLGIFFGMAVTAINALRVNTVKKGILYGIIYIEIASQPILIMAPLLVNMTRADIVQWYVLSFSMHLIYGAVLGAVVSKKQHV